MFHKLTTFHFNFWKIFKIVLITILLSGTTVEIQDPGYWKKESVVHLLLVLTHRFLPWDGPVMMIAIPVLAVTITQQMLHHTRNEFNTIDSLRNLHYGKNIFSIKLNLKMIFFSKNWITPHACALCLKYLGWIKFGLAAVGSNLFSLSLSLSLSLIPFRLDQQQRC